MAGEAIEIRYAGFDEDNPPNPIATVTALHFTVSGVDAFTADPTQDDPNAVDLNTYYLKGVKNSIELLRSHVFGPSDDGYAYWDDVVLPASGSYTFSLMQVESGNSGDSEVTTQSITADSVE
jgi:hypothetical protein